MEKIENIYILSFYFTKERMYAVVTSRFNNETLETNHSYRVKKGFACMYCSPLELSPKIEYNTPVFVIEMNNSTNKIEGIGFIKNKPETTKYYKVHSDSNTNRYTYIGKYFMSREIIDEYNPLLVYLLEEILFKGYTHSKRGTGLTLLPEKLIVDSDICKGVHVKKEIKQLFTYHFRERLLQYSDKIDI
jgi:hypothetical protein